MLAVTVAAHRKMLAFSVGLFCLPYAAFGMERNFLVTEDLTEVASTLGGQSPRGEGGKKSVVTESLSERSSLIVVEKSPRGEDQKKFGPNKLHTRAFNGPSREDIPSVELSCPPLEQGQQKLLPEQGQQKISSGDSTVTSRGQRRRTTSLSFNPYATLSSQPRDISSSLFNLLDDINDKISKKFEHMKHHLTAITVTPLESLALEFYITQTEARSIRLIPTLIPRTIEKREIKPGEMIVFLRGNEIYCQRQNAKKMKIMRSDHPKILGYGAAHYDRLFAVLSNQTCPDPSYLQIFSHGVEEPRPLSSTEIAAAWDREKLFSHTTLRGYSLQMGGLVAWPIEKGENIENIKPEQLINQFWKLTDSEDYLNKNELGSFKYYTLDRIVSSVLFLIDSIRSNKKIASETATSHITKLSEVLNLYALERTVRSPVDERCHYYAARHLASKETEESHKEAWRHVTQCTDNLHLFINSFGEEKKEINWLTKMKRDQFVTLEKMGSSQQKGENYLEFGRFVEKISFLINALPKKTIGVPHTESNKELKGPHDDSELEIGEQPDSVAVGKQETGQQPDFEAVGYYLEGVKHLYDCNKELVSSKIKRWDSKTTLAVACKAFSRSNAESEKNAKQFLTIAQNLLALFAENKETIDHDWASIFEEVISSPIPIASKELITLRIKFLTDLATTVKNINKQPEKVESLYEKLCLKIESVTHQLHFKMATEYYGEEFSTGKSVAKVECSQWGNELIDGVIACAIRHQTADVLMRDKIIHELCELLIVKKYKTKVYLSALGYWKERKKWVTAYNLVQSAVHLTPETEINKLDQLLNEIEKPYELVQSDKRSLNQALVAMIDILLNKKVLFKGQVKNWTEDCHLITKDQLEKLRTNYTLLEQQNSLLVGMKEGNLSEFKTLEKEEYAKVMYEIFGLDVPLNEWNPKEYKLLEQEDPEEELIRKAAALASELENIDEKTKGTILRIFQKGKDSVEEIAENFELSVEAIKAIVEVNG